MLFSYFPICCFFGHFMFEQFVFKKFIFEHELLKNVSYVIENQRKCNSWLFVAYFLYQRLSVLSKETYCEARACSCKL